MKYVDEFRDKQVAEKIVREITRLATKDWTIMEVCGGQTHSIVKHGIDYLLPKSIELVHGPGCPVCVTSLEMIDKAHAIAARPDVIFCTFGDMLRVPGSRVDLFRIKSHGADVRTVYSPLDCLPIAQNHPDKQIVFFAIGFETTAPANAMAVWHANRLGLENLSVLVSHVLVPPAMTAILESPENRVQAFLGPGHVCTVMGYHEYEAISRHYKVPIVITGFEPMDILEGVLMAVRQLESGRAEVENQYARVVSQLGNTFMQELVEAVFEICDQKWRGVGAIPHSGYRLTNGFASFDATQRFHVEQIDTQEPSVCISGEILKGWKKPGDCEAFGKACTPHTPLGATMVSAEGACAAYYNYGRHLVTVGAGTTETN
ncbi:MAG: hydrogenase formation protein HypD [Nitrospira sp. SG-bin1]|nr:MAG: hydrogenase formation protein HypD [Nitrospira sp. SG-bin1]